MTVELKGGLRRLRGFSVAVLLLVLAATTIGVWLLSSDARREIDALATTNSDATQWSLAQSEVELLTLKDVMLEAVLAGDDADLSEVRSRFDVFFSRMSTISSAQVFAEIRLQEPVVVAIETVNAFLHDTIPLIDGSDDDLLAALPSLVERAQEMRMELRTISLAGVRIFAEASEIQRERVANALFELALLTAILFLTLVALFVALMLSRAESHRKTEESLRAEDRLRAIIRTSLDAIVVVNRDGIVLEFNGAAEDVFGYSANDAVGTQMADLIIPDHLRDAHTAGMKRHLETGEKRVVDKGRIQLEAKHMSGAVFPVEMSISSAQSAEGTIYVSFLRDISQRLEDERELVEARDQALAGEKSKAELLAVMSHEMRTPLNGIIGSLQILGETDLSTRQRKFIDVMNTSSEMLLRHVNTVLDISRVDAGHMDVASKVFDPAKTAEHVVESLRIQSESRGNVLEVRTLGSEVGSSIGDPARLAQVLVNLIGNAVKFTEDGRITLEIERDTDSENVEFRVIDTGIGIKEEDLERIFGDFVTLDASYSREVEGTGLGLGIVRRLVKMMNGEIGVESQRGDGSLFWIRLPLPRTDLEITEDQKSAPGDAIPHLDGRGMSVLVIEDNEINRLLAREMLADCGCEVDEAVDGEDGVEKSKQRAYDLILTDISMPKLDGIEASEQIRSGHGPNANTPIVAITAHALPDEIERFHQAGMIDVIVKPITRERLEEVIHRFGQPVSDSGFVLAGEEANEASAVAQLVATLGEERARKLIEEATAEMRQGLRRIADMLEAGEDLEEVGNLSHKIAGTAAVVGASRIREFLVCIEVDAKAGQARNLRMHLDRAKEALEQTFASVVS